MNNELQNNLKILGRHLNFLKKTYKVKNMGIFGSRVRGEHKKNSDIDILVNLSQPMGLFRFIELEDFLSRILKQKTDLVTKKALKPAVKKNILKETVYV